MPKSPAKAAKKTTKIVKTALKAKPKTTVKAKPKMKMKSSVKPAANSKGSRRGFMWKVLEQKQMKQKENAGSAIPSVNPEERMRPTANPHGFARFHGPRRRVG